MFLGVPDDSALVQLLLTLEQRHVELAGRVQILSQILHYDLIILFLLQVGNVSCLLATQSAVDHLPPRQDVLVVNTPADHLLTAWLSHLSLGAVERLGLPDTEQEHVVLLGLVDALVDHLRHAEHGVLHGPEVLIHGDLERL